MQEHSPVLSLCLSGRNDNYGFDFKRRFAQAMNFLAWSAARAGVADRIEVVFADWNSATLLAGDLHLSPEAVNMVRFIEIPPEIAAEHNPSFSPFSQSVAFNVALRRGKGRFLGIMPADVLLTSHTVRNLIGILEGRIRVSFDPFHAVIAVPRKNIPYYAGEARYFTSPEKVESILLAADAWMLCDNTARGMMGGYGVFIMERELLHSLRGVDERIAGWGYNDTDLALRASGRAPVVNMTGYGVCSYDFEPSFRMLMQKEGRRTGFNPIRPGTAENTEQWGLAGLTLRESRAKTGKTEYAETPAKPDFLSWRDWIIWLSQGVPPSRVLFFSSTALLAAWIASRKFAARIFLYGTADRSIPCLLALSVPFAELVVHERYETGDDHERIWRSDNAFGPQHHIGAVHYFPDTETVHECPADLIIVNDRLPSPEALAANCSPESAVVLSPYAAERLKPVFPAEYGFSEMRVRGNLLYQHPVESPEELRRVSAPMNGNIVTRLLAPLVAAHYSKIRKLWAIFFRQPLHSFWHVCRLIRRIRS